MSARYLLRLDDACPTMARDKWSRIEHLFEALEIKPIVAIIPDNVDPDLHYDKPNPGFWERARNWQEKGWAIGLHGFRHQLRPFRGPQFLPFHPRSEFAGLPFEDQAEKIRAGLHVLTANGLRPTVWIAPAHSFDGTTLKALASETSIRTVSDGIARDSYLTHGFTWIPQQLWSLSPKSEGLWTVCLHPNTMTDGDFAGLEHQLRGDFAAAIVSLHDVSATRRARDVSDRLEAANFWRRHYTGRAKGFVKALVRG